MKTTYDATLLSGEMPSDIEKVFSAPKMNLFPESEKDLETIC
jgi:uncharacterized Zn finger protein